MEALSQVPHGFNIGRGTKCTRSGSEPVFDRGLRQAALRTMMRQDFGLSDSDVRKALRQNRSNAGMELLPRPTKQGAVGSLLHQRVLEHVDRIGRCAAPIDELRCDELAKRATEFVLG